jgi:hypothetical protein
MATIRVSNIEAKADASSPTINEKVKITNSNGDVMLQLDGATSGITTVITAANINTTGVSTFTTVNATTVSATTITGVSTAGITTAYINTLSGISTISADSSVYINQNLVFPSGKGIDFSATANSSGTMTSELLSDYEEGTWTGVFAAAISPGGSLTYANNTGRYVKIGKFVHISINISWSAKNSLTGSSMALMGLPFSTENTENYRGGFVIGYTSMSFGLTIYQLAIRNEANSTVARFNYSDATDGGINSEINSSNWPSSGAIFITGTYTTA